MLRKTLLTACILSAAVASASAQQLVAQPGVAIAGPVPEAQPLPIAEVPGQYSAVAPQPALAVTNTYSQPAPTVTTQTHFYTPSYYYYYYQPPYEVQYVQPAAPAIAAPMVPIAPVVPFGPAMSDFGVTPMHFGSFSNARGEMGHVRYPYYSYRRPWYFPGQPSFNVTIPGSVW